MAAWDLSLHSVAGSMLQRAAFVNIHNHLLHQADHSISNHAI